MTPDVDAPRPRAVTAPQVEPPPAPCSAAGAPKEKPHSDSGGHEGRQPHPLAAWRPSCLALEPPTSREPRRELGREHGVPTTTAGRPRPGLSLSGRERGRGLAPAGPLRPPPHASLRRGQGTGHLNRSWEEWMREWSNGQDAATGSARQAVPGGKGAGRTQGRLQRPGSPGWQPPGGPGSPCLSS